MAYGMDRDDYDEVISVFKDKYQVSQKVDFSPEAMREIAMTYKQLLAENNIDFESACTLMLLSTNQY